MQIEETDAKSRGYGSYPVTIIDNYFIPMKDGVKLAAKLWFPSKSVETLFQDVSCNKLFYNPSEAVIPKDTQYPAVLEYLPYRKSDYTAPRDHLRHPWMCSHGYVVLRVDMRGSGDSEGLYYGEYLQQEQDDCVEVLRWIAQQSWSSQAVGMYGKSWGGFNGLQVAYQQPPELKAVISLYSTDDRYKLDVHYDGGCVLGDEMLSWASYMFGFNARAPDPRKQRHWKKMWLQRLQNAAAPWTPEWLRHELRDEFWKQGSICEDFTRVSCPVLAVGGWLDGYTDAVFRMVDTLPNAKGVVGPWPHEWPDECRPGPNMDYLQLCKQWWDQHLKGLDTGVQREPKLRVYLQDSTACTGIPPTRAGKWLSAESWANCSLINTIYYNLREGRCVLRGREEAAGTKIWEKVPYSLYCGQAHGEWLTFGGPIAPSDQRASDAYSLCFTTNPLPLELAILGFANLACTLRVHNHTKAMLAVRLVHVAPSGHSTLITYGYLNLTHREGHGENEARLLQAGEEYKVRVELHAGSYVIPRCHRLRVSLSSCYWPGAWPTARPVDMEASVCCLSLPLVKQQDMVEYKNPLFITNNPKISTPLVSQVLKEGGSQMKTTYDVVQKKLTKIVEHDSGKVAYPDLGLTMQHKFDETYDTLEDDPLSASVATEHYNLLDYGEYKDEEGQPVKIEVVSKLTLTSDERHFYHTANLRCYLNEALFYENDWDDKIERQFV